MDILALAWDDRIGNVLYENEDQLLSEILNVKIIQK
jgi:hypothetical protein